MIEVAGELCREHLIKGTRNLDRLFSPSPNRRQTMGKGILLWLLGIPIPIILLILLFWH
jgi:hypothetical protein